MEIQERIIKIKDYFKLFNIVDGLSYVLVSFPSEWKIPNEKELEENFNVKLDKNSNGEGMYFIAPLENDTANIFDAIDYCVEFNKKLEELYTLYKKKQAELKDLFQTKTLEELKTLKFTFTDIKINNELSLDTLETFKKETKKEKKKSDIKEEKNENKNNEPKDTEEESSMMSMVEGLVE